MDYGNVLTRLCAIPAPSGSEGPMSRAAAELLRPLLDEVHVDRLGSVIGVRRCGVEHAPRILLDAHLDEVGFLVTGHAEGFLRFAPLERTDSRVLPDRELTVLTDPPMLGVVACRPPHVETREEMDQAVDIRDLVLDVGLTQEQAVERIPVGTPIVSRMDCIRLGRQQFCGRALDDRAGFAVLLDALEQLQGEELDAEVWVLGSVQEETGEAGAITGGYRIAPQMCVAVDVTHGRSPDAPKERTSVLGGGPVLSLGPNSTPWMNRRMKRLALEQGICLQYEVNPGSSGTDAWPLQISREGIATAVLSIPLRYMHTPAEVLHLQDLEDTARLLAAFVRGIRKEMPVHG